MHVTVGNHVTYPHPQVHVTVGTHVTLRTRDPSRDFGLVRIHHPTGLDRLRDLRA